MSNLVIVESPTKARTITRFLDKNYNIQSSYGHVRDLPKSEMGVDVEHDFEPKYVTPPKSKKVISNLKKLIKSSDFTYLATDEDREGEAIAWHIVQAAKPNKSKIKRIVFHEITKNAILNALKNPRDIDENLVDAQQARRVLDRLVGYELSPFLWKKVIRGLSAGRVQSVAVRLVVEREREIEKFKPEEYWSIGARLKKQKTESERQEFLAKLIKKDNRIVPKLGIKTKKQADEILENLKNAEYKVVDIRKKETKRTPPPPFITSTLQQQASQRFGFSAKQTMMFAQQLYEGVEIGKEGSVGLITYMRTDSANLSEQALKQAKEVISEKFGKNYSLNIPRIYKKKSKLAQEAHEAIRPTDLERMPENIKQFLDSRQFKLYDLIWKRTLACQMSQAILDSTTVDIEAKNYLFRANGISVKFDGFMKLYTGLKNGLVKEKVLPSLEKNELLKLIKLIPEQHFTQPLPRYTEAMLIKALEEKGIGRPSTYAPTMSTIQDRDYVKKNEEKRLYPTEIGILVNDLLVKHFPEIVDYNFTAKMEEELDDIARGKIKWMPVIKEFYIPFKKHLQEKEKEVSKKELTQQKTNEVCEKCGKSMVIKLGRFGKFLACTGFPECKNTKPIGEEKKLREKLAGIKCDKCGAEMVVKHGKYGPFLGCSKYPECKNIKAIEKRTGARCPECKDGKIIERRSKRGRIFYGCNKYPKCRFVMWQKPTGEICPKCKSLLVFAKGDKVVCSNKECRYTNPKS